jgi:hypothetical protein
VVEEPHPSKEKDLDHANVVLAHDPTTLCEALKCDDASKWEATMEDEYHSLLANGTWELTTLPKSLGGGTIHCFHESCALNGYLKGGYYI